MASNLTAQVRNIADVTTAVAKGDLSKKITVDVRGEILELPLVFRTLTTIHTQATSRPRFRAVLVGAFALLALTLALVGVFGVLAYRCSSGRVSSACASRSVPARPASCAW